MSDLRSFLQKSWPLEASRVSFDDAVAAVQAPATATTAEEELLRKLSSERNYSLADYVGFLKELREIKKQTELNKQEQLNRLEKLQSLLREEEAKMQEVVAWIEELASRK